MEDRGDAGRPRSDSKLAGEKRTGGELREKSEVARKKMKMHDLESLLGLKLLSTDVSANKNTDPALVNLLKVSYTESNFSMAFPYVAASEEAMENSLVSGFAEACGQDFGINDVAFSESCSVEGENLQKLANLHAINVNEIEMFDDTSYGILVVYDRPPTFLTIKNVQDYLASRMEKRPSGHTDLVVFCQ